MSVERLTAVLASHAEALRLKKNVLGFSVSATKLTAGRDTTRPCIRVYVSRKEALEALSPEDVIPKELEGLEVDVVELSTKDYELGMTSKGRLLPWEQKRLCGVKKK